MIKILTIVGARPQFIKAAAVSNKLNKYNNVEEVIVHTGQHFDSNMSDVFFKDLRIPAPSYNLNINSSSHGKMTGLMLAGIEEIIQKEKPNILIVYGDTNSTIAGALAAKKLHIDVAHIEAGLRSFNMKMPEEINRILTDQISDLLFCPTETAVFNLKQEGFHNRDVKIVNSGDVMLDAALFFKNSLQQISHFSKERKGNHILCTLHRAENTDNEQNLSGIVAALNHLCKNYEIILPLHPRTKNKLEQFRLNLNFPTIEPVGYFEMIDLISSSSLVLTDSGGLQKEAYFFSKPCVTMRDETEWTELVAEGVNVLAGSEKDNIISSVTKKVGNNINFNTNFFGSGNASEVIITSIIERYE